MDTKALRQKILDLAIRGKLVPQDPNDEPASVLLEKIREQKQQMFKEGKLKKKDIKNDSIIFKGEDNLHYEKFADGSVKCIEDEIPFELPEGWAWCHYSDVIELYSGQDLTPDRYNDTGEGIPYITGASNLEHGKVIINRWTITPTTHATIGDLLLTVKGSGVGKMAFCDIIDAHIARQIMALRCTSAITPQYLYIAISAMLSNITAQANGIIPGIRREIVLGAYLPLPPRSEQEKICKIADSTLHIIDDIDTNKGDLKKIIQITKSKILDLAIRGKLVPQDPDDESASVLLERIRAEKEELIKQGKIKRDKKESVIFKGEDNSYYQRVEAEGATIIQRVDVPSTWEVCHLQDISYPISSIGMQIKSEETQNDGLFPVISQGRSYIDGYCSDESKVIYDFPIILFGDHTRNVKYIDFPFIVGADGTKLHKIIQANEKYVYYWMCHASEHIADRGYARHYNLLQKKCFMLPPFAEQNRIVNCIEKLFAQLNSICDALS
ncbi:hypothetical protein G4962_13355 [[Ruminococcus] gnavus]|uniref:restriction endonuclease subunit S n=1 Tax=Mediterraneibacter gnavus TaxID=33038 RepID=UPI00156E63E1|nr:restriction endonuclease subunit S [Mediterraneibacter gnavus]NSI46215.1 hypothetical protein [Mediterraneibacter gnavus]